MAMLFPLIKPVQVSKLCAATFIRRRHIHLLNDKAYIGGKWVPSSSHGVFNVMNPSTGEVIGTAPDMTLEDAQTAINAATCAYPEWSSTTAKYRSCVLRQWYQLLEEHKSSLAKIITLEAGKPTAEALGEVNYGNSFVEFYSEEATRVHGEIIQPAKANQKMFIERQPIGVVGLITPWNFPHAMITRKASAAMAAGCTCVVRPAEDTPLVALAMAELAHEAGIPPGVLNIVTSDRGNAPTIGKLLCESPQVAGISFTGSTEVGKLLYRQCADGIKRIGLELGGNAPFIVYSSANINKAVKGAIASKFRNCGQTCVSSNRFMIHNDVYDEFIEQLVTEVENLKIGDGNDTSVHIGPLINKAQIDKVTSMVDDAVSKGAKVLTGGKIASEYGPLFYKPTVLSDITKDMRVFDEEVFGPVINITKFECEEESIRLANDTQRGLAGYFFSEDIGQILRVSRKLEVGMCGVNEGIISAAEAPFGGVKESGLGREGSRHGIDDYTYYKYICIGNLD